MHGIQPLQCNRSIINKKIIDRNRTLCTLFLFYIAVKEIYLTVKILQNVLESFSGRNGAVLASGTTNGKGQGLASAGCILAYQKGKQRDNEGKKFCAGRVFQGIRSHPRIFAGKSFELIIPIGIRKKADIPDNICLGIPVFETKGKKRNLHNDLLGPQAISGAADWSTNVVLFLYKGAQTTHEYVPKGGADRKHPFQYISVCYRGYYMIQQAPAFTDSVYPAEQSILMESARSLMPRLSIS